ncbi:MAG: helix-turn-helix domain-containing protein [Clostridia bacterium]
MNYIISFRGKLTEYLNLEKELGILNNRYAIIGPLLGEARDIESNIVYIRQYMSEIKDAIGPIGQFRHVVWSLVQEMGITLEQLAEQLGCSENTFVNLCNASESLDKESYLKLCDYFQLDKTHRNFIRYCPVLKAEFEGVNG